VIVATATTTTTTTTTIIIIMYKTFNMENNITCVINCNYRIAATLYTMEK
jgi:hypothetical protein